MEIQRQMFHRALIAVMAALVTLAALAMTAPAASAATMRTWTGGGTTNNWTDPGNWGGAAPVAGDDLVFPAGAARTVNTNNFPVGTAFGSIRFTGSGATYTLAGNQVVLGAGGISVQDATKPDVVRIGLGLRLGADQTFYLGYFASGSAQITYAGAIDLSGRALTFSSDVNDRGTHLLTGALSGVGRITIGGGFGCSVVFGGTNTSTGSTTVNRGCRTFVNGDYSARTTTVGDQGVLLGKGTLGTVTTLPTGSSVHPSGDTSPTSILTVKGPFALRAATGFFVDINGTVPGTGYGQLVTDNTVSLAGGLSVYGTLHPAFGQTFTIIANHGGAAISGTFSGLPEGAIASSGSGAAYRITYKGGASAHDVVLTAVSTGNRRTWTGLGTNASWTTPANWVGNLAPKAGDDLYFPAGAARTTNVDNYAAGTNFGSVVFTGNGAPYVISGNRIVLNDQVSVNGAQSETLSTPLTLGANAEFFAPTGGLLTVSGALDLAGHDLYLRGGGDEVLSGVLTGSGKISHSAYGDVYLRGSSPDAGVFELALNGPLHVEGDYHLRSINVISTYSTLTGTGTTAAVTVTEGNVDLTGKLTVNGKLSMTPATTFEPRIGTSGYGQAVVKGPVVLGGALLRLVPTSFIPFRTVFTIISNQGGAAVSGTFAGLPEGATLVDSDSASAYRISYQGGTTGRDVTLTALYPNLGPEADVSVTQTASPDPVAKGDKARFEITVANNGPVPATVTLHDRVPEGTTLVSLSQLAGWSCRTGTGAAGQGINCTSDAELAAGSTQTFTLVVRVGTGAGPTLTNKATVSGDVVDPSLDNNTSTATVAVA